ncbi:Na+/H+ antiporter NhaA [Actimicrobium sp. CCC2.4]|uniref:Na+/H+ antiporter NhaA n=1 Tax=Actimicrobium sp. CCC2.4 TaxID=3048606 RepID=UPI002AC8F9E1|nr:Na+/H+ antiporter NhaA [Actimicrobium sp. CCC2.4]MEB0136494.1 Na+/H+ antiporter NhaA [Actimicrobium sp. CCC2.4]WPX30855.1 Na+/H+ antiporter NhaA [Actimicrobium sp. CCC2.4]
MKSRQPASPLVRFFQSDAAGGVVLMAAAVAAMVVANSPLQSTYASTLQAKVLGLSVEHWVNDALMAVFFLMVGLEIKRELLIGALSSWSQRALPGFAALGGMVVPALIYVGFNWNSPDTMAGWAIPAATDIAFALGVLALLGPRVPVSLKIFLAALAILDDLGAVVIITLFYTSGLSLTMLGAALAVLAVLFVMNKMGVKHLAFYVVGGIVLWFFVYRSGVHATLAGVALAFCIPLRNPAISARKSPLVKLEHGLHPWVAFLVVPVFGFANAGVSLAGFDPQHLLDPVPLGVALGLFIGKQIGVVGMCALAIKAGIAQLPKNSNWIQLYGVALLCGIGFTMSLFIGSLAFAGSDLLIDEVKIGVLIGSILAGVTGAIVVLAGSRKT